MEKGLTEFENYIDELDDCSPILKKLLKETINIKRANLMAGDYRLEEKAVITRIMKRIESFVLK